MKAMNKNRKIFMWYKIKELEGNGLNKSQIGSKLGIHRSTVRKYLEMDEKTFNKWLDNPRKIPKKLYPYYNYVKITLEDTPYLSAAQIEDRLKEKFHELPKVDSKTVYNFVKWVRNSHNIQKYKEHTIRQYQKLPEVEYGSEAQVDFGEYNMLTTNNRRKKVYFFAIILTRSRFKYVYFQNVPFISQTVSYAHELSFLFFGGIPLIIIYDQDKTIVVDENLGDVLLTEEFTKLCQKYPFKPVFCKKADPESKGKIENVVRYVKHNFLKGRTFVNIENLQQECLQWLERTANAKVHGSTKKIPLKEWEIEKCYLQPYIGTPEKPLIKLPKYKVRKDNTIAYKGNFYSLPIGTYKDSNTTVLLEDNNKTLSIYTPENELLAKHDIPLYKGIYVRNSDHKRAKSKTLARLHETVLHELGNTPEALEYLNKLEKDKPRYYRDNLGVMEEPIKQADSNSIENAIRFCLENNILNGHSFIEVLKYYQKQQQDNYELIAINIPKLDSKIDYQSLQPKTSNINNYENLI